MVKTQLPANRLVREPDREDHQRKKHQQVAHCADDGGLVATQQAGAMDGDVAGNLEAENYQDQADVMMRDSSF